MSIEKIAKGEYKNAVKDKEQSIPLMGEPEFEVLSQQAQETAMTDVAELRLIDHKFNAFQTLYYKIYASQCDKLTAEEIGAKTYEAYDYLMTQREEAVRIYEEGKVKK